MRAHFVWKIKLTNANQVKYTSGAWHQPIESKHGVGKPAPRVESLLSVYLTTTSHTHDSHSDSWLNSITWQIYFQSNLNLFSAGSSVQTLIHGRIIWTGVQGLYVLVRSSRICGVPLNWPMKLLLLWGPYCSLDIKSMPLNWKNSFELFLSGVYKINILWLARNYNWVLTP